MNRTITTAAELDALPVGSVVLGADHPAEPRRSLGERISASWDPDARWGVDGRHYYGAAETVLAVLGGAATVLYDPSTPAPAPSAAPAPLDLDEIRASRSSVGYFRDHLPVKHGREAVARAISPDSWLDVDYGPAPSGTGEREWDRIKARATGSARAASLAAGSAAPARGGG